MTNSDVDVYLREINNTPLLTKEEEKQLAERIAKGDEEARELMIRANLRLVVSIAKPFANLGLPLLDLIAEGNLGLIKAVERFRTEEDKRFSTYATWWIRQAITRALSTKTKNIRVPAYMVDMVNHWRKASNELAQQLSRPATPEEVAESMNLSHEKAEAIRQAMSASSSSRDTRTRSDESGEDVMEDIEEMLARAGKDYDKPNLFTDFEEEKMELLLLCLDVRARKIIRNRFGLGCSDSETLDSVGKMLTTSLTRERVRQIELQALKTMLEILTPDKKQA